MTVTYMQARRARLRSEGQIVRLATEIGALAKLALVDMAQKNHRTIRGQLEHLILEEARRNADIL
jgi:hypothetical protein